VADPHPAVVRSLAEIRELEAAGAQILDARSRGRFAGTEPEPRPGLRSGHIPGSKNLPFNELVDEQGLLLAEPELRKRFQAAGVDLSQPIVTACGSGVTACAQGLGLEVLGVHDWAVYDGSWSEYGRIED
jgi:thiosulfate/3-mercaptopyruvate sulfurtransferase